MIHTLVFIPINDDDPSGFRASNESLDVAICQLLAHLVASYDSIGEDSEILTALQEIRDDEIEKYERRDFSTPESNWDLIHQTSDAKPVTKVLSMSAFQRLL